MTLVSERERTIRRALNSAGRSSWARTPPFRIRGKGLCVTRGAPRLPYGRAGGINAYLTHVARDVYIAWEQGRIVGFMVAWRCGARTMMFTLMNEPTSTVCPVCTIHREPRERC